MTATNQESIASRALLVSLSLSTWSARKYDKRVTAEVNAAHAAARDAGRYNKMLLPGDVEPYRALIATRNAARADHYAQTLAWADDGWRLLPSANYMQYVDIMRRHATEFAAALADFLAAYPELREAARATLNGMWRAEDYPTTDDLRTRFGMRLEYTPLPAAGDFRLDLPAGELADMEKRVTDRVERAARDAIADAWTRLGDCVSAMRERLAVPHGDKGSIFRDSLVHNTRDLVAILARLNFTGDAALDGMRARVERELTAFEPQTLRDDSTARADTARAAARILADMGDVYGTGK